MSKIHQYWVYIVTNKGRTVLYTGVTNNVQRRLFEHRTGCSPNSFAFRYQCWYLMYMREFQFIEEAIRFETRVKNWKRTWKEELIASENPEWRDLSLGWDYAGWYDPVHPPKGFYTQHRTEAWGGPEDQR